MKRYFFYLLVFLFPLQAAFCQQDLKPLQADVDNLKQQVSRLQADLASAKESPKPASKEAQDRQISQRRGLKKQLKEKQKLLDQKQKQLNELMRKQKEPAASASREKKISP